MNYEVVIGLETHVELSTESKIFCSCGGHSAANEPNDCVCPACSGMPGMLPVTNKHAIELAVKAGFMLNCHINQYTTFDKKSYYYPDLPCAYQITQWFNPICVNGSVQIGERTIGIKQIHVEEDAGKLVHDDATNTSFVDYNRTSVPLIEIVSRPDFRSSDEVIAYLKKLKSSLQFAGISECEEGAMRCDVNISVRPEGSNELGVRSEIKNMSSLSEIKDAIEFEKVRHVDAIERRTEMLVQGPEHHMLVIAQQQPDIGHVQQFAQQDDAVPTPVDDIAQNEEEVIFPKARLRQQGLKLLQGISVQVRGHINHGIHSFSNGWMYLYSINFREKQEITMKKKGPVAKCSPVIANQSADWCGNPFYDADRYGFPRQCDHWLGMTRVADILQQARSDEMPQFTIRTCSCRTSG